MGVAPEVSIVGTGHQQALALATSLVVVLVEIAHPYPVAAVLLMIVIGFGVGLSGLRGWHAIAAVACSWPAVLLVGPTPDFSASAVVPSGALLVVMAAGVALVGGLWTVLVAFLLIRDLPVGAFTPLRPSVAIIYGVALSVTLGIATGGAVTWGVGSSSGWVLLTMLVVARPAYSETWRRIVNRTLGTVGGGVAAAALAVLVPITPILIGVGAISMAAAIILLLKKANYAVYAAALTAAIVPLNATGGALLSVDSERVLFTVLGALLAAVVVFAIQLALPRPQHREAV